MSNFFDETDCLSVITPTFLTNETNFVRVKIKLCEAKKFPNHSFLDIYARHKILESPTGVFNSR